ncbi:MAG TPA: thioredoxin domain-containing protein [Thermoleophilaceae bacterium]
MTDLAEAVGPRDHSRGAEGATTLLVYGDYECPYTRAAYRSVEVLERRLDGAFRFVFRHFPLTEVHPHALAAAQAAETAAALGSFWEMHELLFEHQKALEREDLEGYASTLGLDLAAFRAGIDSSEYLPGIEHDVRTGIDSGVRGTPTIFLDGEVYDGSYMAAALQPEIERRLAAGRGA